MRWWCWPARGPAGSAARTSSSTVLSPVASSYSPMRQATTNLDWACPGAITAWPRHPHACRRSTGEPGQPAVALGVSALAAARGIPGRARSQGGRCRSWSTRWARQGSNPRPLGCKTSRRHLTEPLPATTVTRPSSPRLRNQTGRLHFVSYGVSRRRSCIDAGRPRRGPRLACGTAASNTAATASDHVLGRPAQFPRLDTPEPVSRTGWPTAVPVAGLSHCPGGEYGVSGDWAGRAATVEDTIRRRFVRRLAGVVPGTRIGRVRWPRPLPPARGRGTTGGRPTCWTAWSTPTVERPSRGGRSRSPRWPAPCGCATSGPGPTTTTTTSPGSAWPCSAPGHWPAAPRRPRSP